MKIIKNIRKIKDQLLDLNTSLAIDRTRGSTQRPPYAGTGTIHKRSTEIEEEESTFAYQTTTAAKNMQFDSNEAMNYSDADDLDENEEYEDYYENQNIKLH